MAIPMLKIRRPNGRLIFNMEIAIRRLDGLYIETGPRFQCCETFQPMTYVTAPNSPGAVDTGTRFLRPFEITQVTSNANCAILCHQTERCRSFNIQLNDHICEFNDIDARQDCSQLESAQGYAFFNKVS